MAASAIPPLLPFLRTLPDPRQLSGRRHPLDAILALACAERHRIFSSTRCGRVLDRAGYAWFRRWRVSAERGLGGEPVAVRPYAEHRTLASQDEPLA